MFALHTIYYWRSRFVGHASYKLKLTYCLLACASSSLPSIIFYLLGSMFDCFPFLSVFMFEYIESVAQRERLNFRRNGATWPKSFHFKHFGLSQLLSLMPVQRFTVCSIRPIKFCYRKTEIELIIGCAAIHILFIVLDFTEKNTHTDTHKKPNNQIISYPYWWIDSSRSRWDDDYGQLLLLFFFHYWHCCCCCCHTKYRLFGITILPNIQTMWNAVSLWLHFMKMTKTT